MNIKKLVSAVSALTIAGSVFAGLAVTANAADPAGTKVIDTNFNDGTYGAVTYGTQWNAVASIDDLSETDKAMRVGNSTYSVTMPDDYLQTDSDDIVTIQFDWAWVSLSNKYAGFSVVDSNNTTLVNYDLKRYNDTTNTNTVLGVSDVNNGLPTWDEATSAKSNDPGMGHKTTYTLTFDYGKKTVTWNDSKADKTYTQNLPENVGYIKTFKFFSNYGNATNAARRCYIDNIAIYTTAEQKNDEPIATDVIISGPDHVFNGKTATYTAVVKDQLGNDFDENVILSLADGAPNGATLEDGVLTVAEDAETGTATVIATSASGITKSITVSIRPAKKFTAKFIASAGDSDLNEVVVAEKTDIEEDLSFTFNYPHYILKNGILYSAERSNGNSSPYGKDINTIKANFEEKVTYNEANLNNVVYFSEAEAINGLIPGTDAARLSSGMGAYATENTVITTLTPGKYTVTIAGRRTAGSGEPEFVLTAGEIEAVKLKVGGSWSEVSGNEFTVTQNTDLVLGAAGDTGHLIDYVLVQKIQPATATYKKIWSSDDEAVGTYKNEGSAYEMKVTAGTDAITSVTVKSTDATGVDTIVAEGDTPVIAAGSDAVFGIAANKAVLSDLTAVINGTDVVTTSID